MSTRGPWPQEQILIDLLPEIGGQTILCTSLGVGQLARAAAEQFASRDGPLSFSRFVSRQLARDTATDHPANLTIGCAARFSPQQFDVVALPLSAAGEAELTRDLLQAGHQLLGPQGVMLASTDNPSDTWLHQELRKLCSRVSRHAAAAGVAYIARKDHAPEENQKLRLRVCVPRS